MMALAMVTFAATGFTGEAEDLSGSDAEADPVDGTDRSILAAVLDAEVGDLQHGADSVSELASVLFTGIPPSRRWDWCGAVGWSAAAGW